MSQRVVAVDINLHLVLQMITADPDGFVGPPRSLRCVSGIIPKDAKLVCSRMLDNDVVRLLVEHQSFSEIPYPQDVPVVVPKFSINAPGDLREGDSA